MVHILKTPMILRQHPEAWCDPNWTWELKWDGWRGVCYAEGGKVQLVSRTEYAYTGFLALSKALAEVLGGRRAVLDGEIVVLDEKGCPIFDYIFSHRHLARYITFDLLSLDGKDLRGEPLNKRRALLRELVPEVHPDLIYSHEFADGAALFKEACRRDLEGVVGKHKNSAYLGDSKETFWVKVKNPKYSQAKGRAERFRRWRAS